MSHRLRGLTAISQYARFDTACNRPKTISERYSVQRAISMPPASAPTTVAAMPMILLTVPTSVGE